MAFRLNVGYRFASKMLLLPILFGSLLACTREQIQLPVSASPKFHVRVTTLDCDTLTQAAAFLNDMLVCLQRNGELIVFDRALNRQRNLEAQFGDKRFVSMDIFGDTAFLVDEKSKLFIVDSIWSLMRRSEYPLYTNGIIFQDSIYTVAGGSFGEFGGSVIFEERRTGRLFSYPTFPIQVLHYKGAYHVIAGLAHMDGMAGYLRVANPHDLFEIPDSLAKYINWAETPAGEALKRRQGKRTNVVYYTTHQHPALAGISIFCSLAFIQDNNLYLVLQKDSILKVVCFDGHYVFPIQEINRGKNNTDYILPAPVISTEDGAIVTCGRSWAAGTVDSTHNGHSYSVIVIKGDSTIVGEKRWEWWSKEL